MHNHETYIGDGLYAYDDGYMITLRAPRSEGDHWVGLETDVLRSFIDFIARSRDLEISVTRKTNDGD